MTIQNTPKSPAVATDSFGRQIPNLPAGYYRHYRGDIYQVIGIGHDSNSPNSERLVVVYIAPPGKPGPALAVRNLFHDASDTVDGSGFFDCVMPDGSLADPESPEQWPLPYTPDYDRAVAEGEGMESPGWNRPTAVFRFTYVGPVRP